MDHLEDLLSRGLPGAGLALLKRSRILTRVAWKALGLYQGLTGSAPNEHRQLAGMEPAPPPEEGGKRVLVFSMRGWTAHLAWETTIARALHLRGAETLTILCDKVMPACEPRTVVDDYASTCDRCAAQSARFLEGTGLPFAWLGTFLEPGAEAEAASRVRDLDLAALRSFRHEGVPIGRLVGASVNRHLLRAGSEPTPEFVEAYRRFVGAGILAQGAAERLLDSFRPTSILLLNGLFFTEAILMEAARRREIPVWAYERAKRRDSLVFSRDEPVVRQSFDERWNDRRTRPLTEDQESELEAYIESRFAGDVGIERLWPEQAPTGEGAAEESAAAPPTAVLFTNVLWDTAVYESDIAFDSMADWVGHTIGWFRAHPGRNLVIRVHPAEVRVPFKRSRDPVRERIAQEVDELPENVRVVSPSDPESSYELLLRADLALVYASTIGLEAALKGIPTVVAGRTHYRGRGFTLDPHDRAEYDELLERGFGGGTLSEEERGLARRYAYLYFFEEIIPFRQVTERPRSYVTFNYEKNAELAPGRDPVLDAICHSILTGALLTNPLAR